MTHWDALATLTGGVGLFLLGMTMMSDGLRMAAGPSLERNLRAATHTPWHGLGSGVLVTALVQSSSAVTVATIGFVKAGLLPWLLAATRAAGAWLNLPRNWRCFVATIAMRVCRVS